MSQPDSDVVPLDDLDGVGKRVNGYGVDAVELGELVARRDTEGLNNFGGLAGLAHQLGADLKGGLNADEAKDNYARRVRAYVSFPIFFGWKTGATLVKRGIGHKKMCLWKLLRADFWCGRRLYSPGLVVFL
jgi:hypothetical protein